MCTPPSSDKQSSFDWLPQREEAFIGIKELITQAPVLRYFDVNKEVTIECDSSDVGLGTLTVLTKDGCPVANASCALIQMERNYAQIEKDCLCIIFAAERCEHYILGKDIVQVLSAHKPLMFIFANLFANLEKPQTTSANAPQAAEGPFESGVQAWSSEVHQ